MSNKSNPYQDTEKEILPILKFTNEPLERIIKQKSCNQTLIIVDDYNYKIINKLTGIACKEIIPIEDSNAKSIEEVKSSLEFNRVIAIGGCSALDFGRACAKSKIDIIIIPSILSTSCISVDCSIIYDGNNHFSVKTPIPKEVIISFPLLTKSNEDIVKRWTFSGIADYLSNISATIQFIYENNQNLLKKKPNDIIQVLNNYLPDCMKLLKWILNDFTELNHNALMIIARHLYNAGIIVIKNKNPKLSAGTEHELYYYLKLHKRYNRDNPTHGELVSIGTLIAAKMLEEQFNQEVLFLKLLSVFKKLKLPTKLNEFKGINVKTEDIIEGFEHVKNSSLFWKELYSHDLLNSCYMAN